MFLRGFLALLLCGVFVSSANAHNRSQSFSTWHLRDDGASVVLTASAREVTRLVQKDSEYQDLSAVLARAGVNTLALMSKEGKCALAADPRPLNAREGFAAAEYEFSCKGAPTELHFETFFNVAPGHTNFAKLRGEVETETLFTSNVTQVSLQSLSPQNTATLWSVAGQYLALGVTHIATGYDHLAFLLALLIFSLSVRSVLLIVTGFTLGHSITLSLAALGFLTPNTQVVEAVIGFTIALVAVENLTARRGLDRDILTGVAAVFAVLIVLRLALGSGMGVMPLVGLGVFAVSYLGLMDSEKRVLTWRPAITATFGLVHGLGFASILLEQELPTGHLVAALFSFNLGVELGQLVAVALFLVVAALVSRLAPVTQQVRLKVALSGLLVVLGLFWLGTRTLAA